MPALCNHITGVPSAKTAKIQAMHVKLGHIICVFVKAEGYLRG